MLSVIPSTPDSRTGTVGKYMAMWQYAHLTKHRKDKEANPRIIRPNYQKPGQTQHILDYAQRHSILRFVPGNMTYCWKHHGGLYAGLPCGRHPTL